MGYRAHYAKKYEVEYGEGAFNWQQPEFNQFVSELGNLSYCVGGDSDEYELDVDELKAYVEKLQNSDLSQPSAYFKDYTKADELGELQAMLNGYDKSHDYIYISWF